MEPVGDHRPDADIEDAERLLVAARPVAREQFVASTESDLFGRRARGRRAPRAAIAAFGISGLVAAVFLVAGLAGSGPIAPGGSDEVRARQDCQTTTVRRAKPVGEVRADPSGQATVVTRDRLVPEAVRRCR